MGTTYRRAGWLLASERDSTECGADYVQSLAHSQVPHAPHCSTVADNSWARWGEADLLLKDHCKRIMCASQATLNAWEFVLSIG